MKNKLWEQSVKLNPLVEAYTVGDDHIYDTKLLPYDLKASLAHGKMLKKIGIINDNEYKKLKTALNEIKSLHKAGKFKVTPAQEDSHTAIEQYITENYGDVGKKIHTARSRNDQALTMLRLYMKDMLSGLVDRLEGLSGVYGKKAQEADAVPMPGYTHMQKAMPSTVSDWLAAYGEAFSDLTPLAKATLALVDSNPLGTAAGFGLPGLKIDRELTTRELDFAKTQHNPVYAGLSRGYFELAGLQLCELIMTLCARFASDMLLFTTQEFDYFSLPDEFTTGSSIMPNKHNYDLFEVMRGNGKVVAYSAGQVQAVVAGIGSGFQRDLQLTKGPFMQGSELTLDTLNLLQTVVPQIVFNKKMLKAAMTDDLYATEKVYELVACGVSFRDAYKQVKAKLESKG